MERHSRGLTEKSCHVKGVNEEGIEFLFQIKVVPRAELNNYTSLFARIGAFFIAYMDGGWKENEVPKN